MLVVHTQRKIRRNNNTSLPSESSKTIEKMKAQLVILLAIAVSLSTAEPPRRRARPAWAAPQRQVSTTEAPPAEEEGQDDAPYPPSGWRPSKAFYLPGEYGAPNPEEEDVSTTTTEAAETTTTVAPEGETTTTAEGVEEEEENNENDYDAEPEPAPANAPTPGVYYVLLPDGRIQRVSYQSIIPAPPSGRYVIEEVGPSNPPLFAYGGSASLIRLFKK